MFDSPTGLKTPRGSAIRSHFSFNIEETPPTQSAPAPAKKRGRKKLWDAAVFTNEERDKAAVFMKKYGKDPSARERVLADYRLFCVINKFDFKGALDSCVGQMLEKLAIGTIDTYTAYVASAFPSSLHRQVRKAVQRAHADDDVEGAPRFPRDELLRLTRLFPDEFLRRAGFLLWLAGIRPIAGRRLRRHNFAICTARSEHASVLCSAWGKTVQKRSTRQHLRLPRWLAEGLTMDELRSIMGSGDRGEQVFESATCDRLNAALKAVTEDGKVPPTSYSYRRAYVQAVFEHYKGNGEQMKLYTLHFSDQVVKAHYVDWFVGTEQRPDTAEVSMGDSFEDDELKDV